MPYIIISIFIVFLAGCTALPEPIPAVNVALKAEVSDEISDKMEQREVIFLELGVIPGGIYGSPLEDPRWYIDLNEDSAPSLDVANFEIWLNSYAKPRDVPPKNSLSVSPAETAMVRVSTFGVDNHSKTYLSGGLLDGYSNPMMLVYFDRPCTVKGRLDFGKEGIFEHNIEVPEAGLYRLIAKGFSSQKNSHSYKIAKTDLCGSAIKCLTKPSTSPLLRRGRTSALCTPARVGGVMACLYRCDRFFETI